LQIHDNEHRAIRFNPRMKIILKLLTLLSLAAALSAQELADRLQKGLFEEEVNHNLEAAIRQYRSIIEESAEQRRITATALYRLAESHRKLGRTNEAADFFSRLLREYPEQQALAAKGVNRFGAPSTAPRIASALGLHGNGFSQIALENAVQKECLASLTNLTFEEMRTVLPVVVPSSPSDRLAREYATRKAALSALLVDYSEEHPMVTAQRQSLRTIEQQIRDSYHAEMLRLTVSVPIAESVLGATGDADPGAIKTQIALEEANLAGLLKRYREQYPRVRESRARLEALNQQLLLLSGGQRPAPTDEREVSAERENAATRAALLQSNLEALRKAGTNLNALAPLVYPTPIADFLREQVAATQAELAAKAIDFGDEHPTVLRQRAVLNAYAEEFDLHVRGLVKGLEIRLRMAQAGITALDALARKGQTEPRSRPNQEESEKVRPDIAELAGKLEQSPDLLDASQSQGFTPLQKAAMEGDLEMMRFLLARGASPNKQTAQSGTALHLAVLNGRLKAAEMLIEAGANVNERTRETEVTPLIEASGRGFKHLVQLLLERGAKPNERTKQGWTALHSAVHDPEILKLLLASGGDPNLTGPDGATLLKYAEKHPPAVELLIEHGAKTGKLSDAEAP
jgi:ankyrin repeat protein